MFLFEQLNEKIAPPQQVQQSKNQQVARPQKMPMKEPTRNSDEYEEYSDDEELDDVDGELEPQENSIPPDLAPLQKYFLIQKLNELENRLEDYNIKNNDLETILKFANNLSYNSLLLMSNGIVLSIEDQIARLTHG